MGRAVGFQSNNGIFVSRSDDGGQNWQIAGAVETNVYNDSTAEHGGMTPVPFDIIPDLAIDTFQYLPGGKTLNPNYGSLYEVWSHYYPAGQFPGEPNSTGGSQVMIAVSRDGGINWQTQLALRANTGLMETVIEDSFDSGTGPGPGAGTANWPHLAVGPEGDVYVAFFNAGDFSVFHSDDGGKTFTAADPATGLGTPFGDAIPSPIALPTENFRVQSVRAIAADPTRPGSVYAAEGFDTKDAAGIPADPGDIFFSRSADSGLTWQSEFQLDGKTTNVLNDDNGGLVAQNRPDDVVSNQAMPRLVVDAQGDVALIWYDTRRDPNDHNLDVFASISTDGGQTFSPNFRITNVSFDPDAGQFVDATGNADDYIGDTIGLA